MAITTINNMASLKKRRGRANGVMSNLSGYSIPDDGFGGLFYWDATYEGPGNGGTIIKVDGVTVGAWRRDYEPTLLNLGWFGLNRGGAVTNSPQWRTALDVLPQSGGTIRIPEGDFMSSGAGSNGALDPGGFYVHRDNVIIEGAGKNSTFLRTPANSNVPGMQIAPYRQEGWIRTPALTYTYEDTMNIGQGYVDIREGNEAIMSSLTPGTKIFICAGGSYYDQHYGDFNIVHKVDGRRVYLKKHLNREYSSIASSNATTLASPFTPPAVGEMGIAVLTSNPPIVANLSISIGNDLYEIVTVSGLNVTVRNIGKGNGTAQFPAGTKVFKSRCIFLTPSTAVNVQVKNLTIDGHRKGIIISNSMDTYFSDVRILRQPGTVAGGWWIDGDDGRDCLMERCYIESDNISGSQMARSFSGFTMKDCQLHQCLLECSEFNVNFNIVRNRFDVVVPPGGDDRPVINVGQTTSNIVIDDNYIFADGCSAAIQSTDIQGYGATSAGNVTVTNNTIKVNNVARAIDLFRPGNVEVYGNTINGRCAYVFGNSDGYTYGNNNTLDQNQRYVLINSLKIYDNTFAGYTDGLFGRDPLNLYVERNIINRIDDYTPGGGATPRARGNIIYGNQTGDKGKVERLVFRNNFFKNWRYYDNSFNPTGTPDFRWDISNNRFVDAITTVRDDKDFVITLFDEQTTNYGSINFMPLVRSMELDWATYLNYVALAGGKLEDIDITGGRNLLTQLYDYSLRGKISALYPFLGNVAASRVPLLGWEKTIYKSFAQKTLTSFSPNLGWSGDSASYGVLFKGREIDVTNAGLFVQLTKIPTTTAAATFVGRRDAGNTGSRFEITRSGGQLSGIAGTSIVQSGYTHSLGFIASSQMSTDGITSVQTNYINSTANNTSNTNAGTPQRKEYQQDLYLLGNSNPGLPQYSDAGIGAVGITTYLTLQETEVLRTIIYNLMLTLGRPVQAGIPPVLPDLGIRNTREYYRPEWTSERSDTDLNNEFLNTPIGTSVFAENTTDGGIHYKKCVSGWKRFAMLTTV